VANTNQGSSRPDEEEKSDTAGVLNCVCPVTHNILGGIDQGLWMHFQKYLASDTWRLISSFRLMMYDRKEQLSVFAPGFDVFGTVSAPGTVVQAEDHRTGTTHFVMCGTL